MRVTQLIIENVKRIKAIDVMMPDDNVVVITGKNKQGKSSFIDSLVYAFGGKSTIPAKALREGTQSGHIIAKTDGDKERDIPPFVVTLQIKPGNVTSLRVEAAGGYRPRSQQAFLDGFYSAVTFDPLAFMRMKPADQVAMLRELVGLDFTEQDKDRQAAYDKRTGVNRELSQITAQLNAIGDPIKDVPEAVDVQALLDSLADAHQVNSKNADTRQNAADALEYLGDCDNEVEALTAQLRKARAERTEAKAKADGLKTITLSCHDVDAQAIQDKIAAAGQANDIVRQAKEWNESRERLTKAKAIKVVAADTLTAIIDKIAAAKRQAMADATWPVDGLGFDEDGVTFNGLPLDVASSAEGIDVSVGIGAALNPLLCLILIREGSLLDDDSMAMLRKIASERKLQVVIERVDDESPTAIVIEDGHVRD